MWNFTVNEVVRGKILNAPTESRYAIIKILRKSASLRFYAMFLLGALFNHSYCKLFSALKTSSAVDCIEEKQENPSSSRSFSVIPSLEYEPRLLLHHEAE